MTLFPPGRRIAVLLPLPLAGPLDYLVGEGQTLTVGDFVRVPLNHRSLIGVVWSEAEAIDPELRCRSVNEVLPVPPLPQISRLFVDWVAQYCVAAPGAVLKMVLSAPKALEAERPAAPHWIAGDVPAGLALTAARERVLAASRVPMMAASLARAANVSAGVVRAMIDCGLLRPAGVLPQETKARPLPVGQRTLLSAQQVAAAAQLCAASGDGFSVSLLQGVTGSGKTEVYFEAIAAALARQEQILVLLPEIALSAQWLERFTARFGFAPLLWHSEVGEAQRQRNWRDIAGGAAGVVVGARSALFLPFTRLGLLIVDEEHDGSFKQEEGVCYHARDMAVVRARLGQIPIILASATPSLESLINVENGRYRAVYLPDRHGGASLPRIDMIDLRRHPPPKREWISPPLREAIAACLARGEQALLFLNRRGYAPLTLCGACGHRLECPHCSAWLVEHRHAGRLQCHHCGFVAARPEICPHCEAKDRFTPCGPGVERVAEEALRLFPAARQAVMASDLLSGPKAASELVSRMAKREIDLLIGTQIVAKGHHFPSLTLVGVIDADLGLAGGDLRAGERTFQLLNQVAGRAGRASDPGQVLLQSFQPDQKVMQALARGEAENFAQTEAAERKAGGWPPFGRLAALIVSGIDASLTDQTVAAMARLAPRDPRIECLGPAPAPLALLRGRHRRRFLLKSARNVNIQAYIRHWLGLCKVPRPIRVQVDIDPYSFL